jgi:putative spermidine/putrescine transport system ATP-binding protein
MVGQEQGKGHRAVQLLGVDLTKTVAAPDIKLSIREVGKTYGSVTALAGASLELAEGEFLTLLGPSGSGKTTLLMVVAGLVAPSGGEVWIDGKLATYAPPDKRDIGVVFQNYALFPHMTIAENIGFPLKMRRLPTGRITEEVRRVLDVVQLSHVAGRFPRELSGGQQQRIALARCMVYGPSIILMDEPLGALDRKLRDQMQMEIKSLHGRLGITVLYVTHDQEEALVMSDRICLMNNGRIEQIGTPQDLYFKPRTIFAADFLGESNILEGTVTETGGWVTVSGPGELPIRAHSDAALRVGERVKVVIRPENLRLLAAGEAADNVAQGSLRDVVFVGGVSRSFVTLADGVTLSVKQLTDRAWDTAPSGGGVRLGWDAARTIALPVGESG